METEDMILRQSEYTLYGIPMKYYSYYDYQKEHMVVTDNYDEYITHFERNKMGGNIGVHLGFIEHDPPLSIGPQFVK
jgi:hypothetical protein